jgi:hypothetical protein
MTVYEFMERIEELLVDYDYIGDLELNGLVIDDITISTDEEEAK